jgi:glycerophosphoryl diester phosphodiesterase
VPYEDVAAEVLIKDLTVAEIQEQFRCDKLFRGPTQQNDPALSPVTVAFFGGDASQIYVLPTLQQLFDFVTFYTTYYRTGPGSGHPMATKRWKNAQRVRFNVETKVNPRTDEDPLHPGQIFALRTIEPTPFAQKVANVIVSNGMQERADIQSFDFRTLLVVQEQFPQIRTVYLFGDFPKFDDPAIAGSDDGTNMQPQAGAGPNTPWMAGMFWPYRSTKLTQPFRAQTSGGFEGMAITPDKHRLLPLLEKPLAGDDQRTILMHEFDLASSSYTGNRFKYQFDPRGVSIGDFILTDEEHGLIIERDNTQGDLNGFKAVYKITLGAPGTFVNKELAVDLLRISDPHRISEPGQPGDVGIGRNFAFPFTTIEDVLFFDEKHIGILNDNNFPFSVGRHVGSGQPDDEEFIIIKLDRPL